MEFKVGQKVELINNNGMAASLGATAVVTKIHFDWYGCTLLDVVWKTNFNNQMNSGYESYHFKPMFREGQQLLFAFMGEQSA